MSRGGLIYIGAIVPLHYFAMLAASLPPALLLPPDVLVQAIVAVPLFMGLLCWSVPAMMRALGLLPPTRSIGAIRLYVLAIAGLSVALALFGILMGFFTPLEAAISGMIILLLSHILLINRLV